MSGAKWISRRKHTGVGSPSPLGYMGSKYLTEPMDELLVKGFSSGARNLRHGSMQIKSVS